MKKRTSLNKIIIFNISLLIISIVFGIVYYLLLGENKKNDILLDIENLNNILIYNKFNIKYIIIIFIIYTLSISVIGVPFILFYLFFEGFSIGFLIIPIITNNGLLGLIYYFIYLILFKIILLSILIYLSYLSITNTFKLINTLINSSNESFIKTFKYNIIRFGICLIIIIINETIIYFIFNKVLLFFKFLL